MGRILALKRRKARRIDFAGFEIDEINHLAWLRRRHAVETIGRQAVLLRVAEEGIDSAIIGDRGAGALLVGHHMRPGTRRTMGQTQFGAVGGKSERPAGVQCKRGLD